MTAELVHMVTVDEWEKARLTPFIEPTSLVESGFVHLSTRDQVRFPANRLFAKREDILLLFVDENRLGAPIRWEPGVPDDPDSMVFPHLYGPLPVASVTRVEAYRLGADGLFT